MFFLRSLEEGGGKQILSVEKANHVPQFDMTAIESDPNRRFPVRLLKLAFHRTGSSVQRIHAANRSCDKSRKGERNIAGNARPTQSDFPPERRWDAWRCHGNALHGNSSSHSSGIAATVALAQVLFSALLRNSPKSDSKLVLVASFRKAA